MDRPAKVADFELAVDTEEKVLGFDVAMDDMFPVEVHERVRHLGDVLLESIRPWHARVRENGARVDARAMTAFLRRSQVCGVACKARPYRQTQS
jgi:hypothetical protein